MGWVNELSQVLQKYSGEKAQAAEAPQDSAPHQDFDKVAQAAPRSALADAISEAFRSNSTPPFAEMIAHLFTQSSGEQKAGILNRLLSSGGPDFLTQAAGTGMLAKLAETLGASQQVTPEKAQQVAPEAVKQLADRVQHANPSIIEMAGEFYAQHPALVKTLGAGALALAMSKMSRRAA